MSGDDEIGSGNILTNNNMDVIFLGQNSNNNCSTATQGIAATTNRDTTTNNRFPNKYNNSCKTLQRKLELKVERAKKNYSQQNGSDVVNDTKCNNASLIPINRLPIPGYTLPLVEYKSDHSDSEDEEFTSPFFPTKTKAIKKLDLSDTFSIQEMTIESDDSDGESGDSQNLELLPPSVRIKFIDKIINYFCCSSP
ncbi:uncharacterized protein LOC116349644 [Contarinia nasturtii]|uniref:uncharacterized protein LOC116348421 n=1 Tax=Contarinia nasturtii TaxID=265458 RepID=UPI0012D448DA|nr:uncharacterized protein LOC116348421 [Contarinia nasturtii]XP_031637039.1 uncharacterized protein LOC116349644 [Contarinia nasturtii]